MSVEKFVNDLVYNEHTIGRCYGTAYCALTTVKLSSKNINVFNYAQCYEKSGIELSDTKYLDVVDLSQFNSVGELGLMIRTTQDVDTLKKFMDRVGDKIHMYHLMGNKDLIEESFELGTVSIMGNSGRIFYQDHTIDDNTFTIQGMIKPEYINLLKRHADHQN